MSARLMIEDKRLRIMGSLILGATAIFTFVATGAILESLMLGVAAVVFAVVNPYKQIGS